jgi:hypothetical protein
MKKYFATSIFSLQFLTPTISGILSSKELFLPDKQILSAEKIKALKTFLREIEEEPNLTIGHTSEVFYTSDSTDHGYRKIEVSSRRKGSHSTPSSSFFNSGASQATPDSSFTQAIGYSIKV